jgi:hypothetical protein
MALQAFPGKCSACRVNACKRVLGRSFAVSFTAGGSVVAVGQQTDTLLPSWAEVNEYAEWTGVLVGNGASIAVWPEFRYGSLYGVATSDAVSHPLTAEDIRLFEAFETENFEQILAALKTAGIVADALDLDVSTVEARYESAQRAMFEAVHAVHVPWEEVATNTIGRLFDALREYRYVYSTNYDLLLYWASMDRGGKLFLDYFWGEGKTFDGFNTAIWETRKAWTRILFIHGGIHLRRLRSGGTRKVLASDGSILEQFETGYSGDESPLLVSEGDSRDKFASITSSDYLSFAHQMFALHEGGLVVFGHSLSEQDDHLVRPMRSWRGNPIAISMRPKDDEEQLIQEQDRFRSRLSPMKDVVFFDSTTHPLGDRDLTVRRRSGLFRRS